MNPVSIKRLGGCNWVGSTNPGGLLPKLVNMRDRVNFMIFESHGDFEWLKVVKVKFMIFFRRMFCAKSHVLL